MLTYAIGDIHGCHDELVTLLAKIEKHAAGRDHKIITLGDYSDRGPNSKGVLDVLMSRPDIIKLMGNHERMFLDALADYDSLEHFLIHGGKNTLASYGASAPGEIDSSYIDFIKGLRLYYEDDHRVFVHAGIDPNITDMSQQREMILLWIREPFLGMIAPHFKHVVHGHTPQQDGHPDLKHNRTNLDTCCFATGVLTAGVFDDTQAAPIDTIQVRSGFKGFSY